MTFKKPLRVGTLNVRGLGERRKQCQLKRLLNEKEIDVLAIQETKIESEDRTDSLVKEFGNIYSVCVSHAVGVSAGCCIFLRNSTDLNVENVISCESGRLVLCDFTFVDVEFRLICVYAPNEVHGRLEFFQSIRGYLSCGKNVLLLGDFNCVCVSEDKSGSTPFMDGSTKVLVELIEEYELIDVGQFASPSKCLRFTHFQGSSHARLDRAYVSLEVAEECNSYSVENVSFSDHCLVSFTIGKLKEKANKFNWDLWKLNARLLNDPVFCDKVDVSLIKHLEDYDTDWGTKWELFKQEVKVEAVERASVLKKLERRTVEKLRCNLTQLLKLESDMPGLFKEDIAEIKSKLEAIDKIRFEGAIVRARAERFLAGEQPTRRALCDEKRYAKKRDIESIIYHGDRKSVV